MNGDFGDGLKNPFLNVRDMPFRLHLSMNISDTLFRSHFLDLQNYVKLFKKVEFL